MVSPHLLYITNSYSFRTYEGSYEGAPSAKKMIEVAKRTAKEMWGERPTLVMEPTVKNGMLPSWTNMVWAAGPAEDDENHGSELVIIWWGEIGPDTDRVLQAVDWKKHAKDFQI